MKDKRTKKELLQELAQLSFKNKNLTSQLEKAKEAIYNECDKTTDERGRKYLESVIKLLEAGE